MLAHKVVLGVRRDNTVKAQCLALISTQPVLGTFTPPASSPHRSLLDAVLMCVFGSPEVSRALSTWDCITCLSACMGCLGPDVNHFKPSEQTGGCGCGHLGMHAWHSWGMALEAGARSGSGLLGMGCVPRKGLGQGWACRDSWCVWLPQSTEVFEVFHRRALLYPCELYECSLASFSAPALVTSWR